MPSRQTASAYLEHFGLRERPFSNAPDLRFVYLGQHHAQAITHLRQGMEAPGSIVLLTGESGLGKTTMSRVLLSRLPERVDVVPVLNPSLTPDDLLAYVCEELGVTREPDAADRALLENALRSTLTARLDARRTVLIVDDAHGLGPDVVEELSALSRMAVDGRNLLQIVLIGEPPLIDLVGRAAGPAASQPTGYYLLPFAERDTGAYVRHRLAVAGARDLFDDEALRDVHWLSTGMPRLINVICDHALAIAVPQGRRTVDAPTVRAAARSALDPARSPALGATRQEAARPKPTLTALQPALQPARRARRPLRLWLVGGGLALNAVVIGMIFVAPRHLDGIGTPASALLENEPATSAEPAEPTRVPVVAESPPAPQSEPTQPTETLAQPDESSRQRRRRERAELSATASRPAETPPSPPTQPLPGLVQPLPGLVQPQPLDGIPLKINMLVWAPEPRKRMVYVNGRRYVEGDMLESGAVLQEIQPDGIVLIQGGRQFRLRSQVRY